MMAAQSYPSSSGQYPLNLSPTQGRNMYRNTGSSTPVTMHHGQFNYPTPTPPHSSVYRSPVPELTTFGLVTPPTTTPSQFSSPLVSSGGFTPMSVGTPTQSWGSLNALALSPISHMDPALSYGYHQPSPILGHDGAMTAAGEVFSTVPLRHHDMGGDALGFHHPVYTGHRGGMFGGPGLGIKTGPHGHLLLGADGQTPTEIKKRTRSAQACERCRIRKARCFGGNPCNRCTKRRFVCEFSTAVRQRGPNKPQVNASLNGSAGGPTSAPPTVASTLANSKVNGAGSASSSATGTPDSPSKNGGTRRHSLPEGPTSQYIPHAPAKSFSTTEVPRLAAVTEEGGYLPPNWTVVPNLPTPTAEYLAVPQPPASAGGMRTDVSFFSVAPTVGTTTPVSGAASANGGERSPLLSYTPEMDSSAPTTSSSVDYPYTPVSPATTFSPTLSLTPTGNAAMNPNHVNVTGHFAAQQDTFVNV